MLTNFGIFFLSAFFEIFGCFAFWLYFRVEKSFWWLGAGVVSLTLFAYLLTKIDVAHAGRIYAIYGGVYILCSLAWLILVEKENLKRWDIIGVCVALSVEVIICLGNKSV